MIFRKYPELRTGLFAKSEHCQSDEECARQLGFEKVAKLNQVHGNMTYVVTEPTGFETEGDGLITATPGLALSVRFADCQAFAIYAPKEKIVGVLHTGWRGMALKAITAFYRKLEETFGIEPKETFVAAAPSLCKKCATFSKPFEELPEHLHPFVEADTNTVDLQAAADAELSALGVPRDHRERHPSCTMCDERFWSWRRDRRENARNYLIVGMRNA